MDKNILIPLILYGFLIVVWLVCEWRGSRTARIVSGLICILGSGAFAGIVMNAEEIVIGMHVSVLIEADEEMKRMEVDRVRTALNAYRKELNASDNPKAAAFVMQEAFQNYDRRRAAQR